MVSKLGRSGITSQPQNLLRTFSAHQLLALPFQGRRASLRLALAPGYYSSRRWRSSCCTSNLNPPFEIEIIPSENCYEKDTSVYFIGCCVDVFRGMRTPGC